MNKLFMGLFLVVFMEGTFATLSGYTKIKTIYTYGNVAVLTLTSNAFQSDCINNDRLLITFDSTAGKEMYSAALAASLADKTISFGYTKSACTDYWGTSGTDYMPTIYRIDIRN